jgi:hypothetical protein
LGEVELGIEDDNEDEESDESVADADDVDVLFDEDDDTAEDETEQVDEADQRIVPITIKELDPAIVPELRREPFYVPLPVSEKVTEHFETIRRGSTWSTTIRPHVLEVLNWVGLNGIVTTDSVATYFNKPGGPEEARELLAVAEGAGWLHHSELLRAEKEVFFATEEGLQQVGLPLEWLLVDYRNAAHYACGNTCMRARIGAALANEFPNLMVKTRWELRADGYFSGDRMLDISKITKFSGEHKHADLMLIDEADPYAPYGIVLAYPYEIKPHEVKAPAKAWIQHPRCGHLHLFIDSPSVRKAVTDFVTKELKQADRVTVWELPISECERALRISRVASLVEE